MDKIADRVLHYGHFKEALDKVVDLMRSEYPSSVIIRGDPGSGKKTLIDEAIKLTNVKNVVISPEHYTDDYVALKAIANEVVKGKVKGSTISDIVNEIRQEASKKDKLVIVLEDFEDLCSRRQSLLYNLMNLIQTNPHKVDKGPNLTLIGLTCNLEWAHDIEKRVRSRLNAKCIGLNLPYENCEEYIEFAALLLNGYKINKDFRDQLEYMYWCTNRSIRFLKKYLLKICDIDEKGELLINFDANDYIDDYQVLHNNLLRERLKHLTKTQLDLLKAAVNYCKIMNRYKFSLKDLERAKEHYTTIDFNGPNLFRDFAFLVKLRLFKPEKIELLIGMDAYMYPAVTPGQLKAVIEVCPILRSIKSDNLWMALG